MLGGLSGGVGLLGVAAGGVPTGGGEGDQDQGGDEHGGGAAVLAPTERASGPDDAPDSRAERSGIGARCADVAAGGTLEGAGGSSQLGAGGSWGGLGDRIQEFSDADEMGGGFVVVVSVEEDGGALDGSGGASSFSGGRGPVRSAADGPRSCLLGPAALYHRQRTDLPDGGSQGHVRPPFCDALPHGRESRRPAGGPLVLTHSRWDRATGFWHLRAEGAPGIGHSGTGSAPVPQFSTQLLGTDETYPPQTLDHRVVNINADWLYRGGRHIRLSPAGAHSDFLRPESAHLLLTLAERSR